MKWALCGTPRGVSPPRAAGLFNRWRNRRHTQRVFRKRAKEGARIRGRGRLAVGGVFAGGALEGVVAAGGEVDGAFAQGHRLFYGDDLEAGDGGEAGFFVEPAEAASVIMGLVGSVRVRNTPTRPSPIPSGQVTW